MNITNRTSTNNTSESKGRTINYIVIHYTAGTTSRTGSAANTANYFKNTSNEVSADYIIDDGTIVQYNPDIKNRYCWHCGGSKYNTKGGSLYGVAKNSNSIGIEVCSTNSSGKVLNANDASWSYTSAVIDNTVELVKTLMKTYGIPSDHVIRHYDVTGKLCPGIIGWNADSGDDSKWRAFKNRFTGEPSVTDQGTGLYHVSIPDLNIRKGPGTNYATTGRFTGIGTFTIVETSNGTGAGKWGRLKSGAGWISLDYAKKK